MLQSPKIGRLARLRRFEIAQELSRYPSIGNSFSNIELPSPDPLNLNICVSLQPRFSLSIWIGRGA
jgi:hypothetical protein